ncbi:ubiquitin carboxyl-terminal hydrolase 16 isoform X1 [Falco rusticolus]|uniref:ubiquitin carboxyl-terminal hydrolase 16 isoform X1 n=1 Tax=Falco rusticolus TaxID=120794 RepID=UPI00038707E3|nr:ubiquitin carboxyl-terminal hydrolase 16 isoform X1 [Falco rusticolus]XP_037233579.1 ubiquitin carboxyl-terminal hydrolase 16 isoform X1 [Falco rusticolus]XP_037233580.1 ubiquitin carboxyl-terminal hydrolase 16 isoform X1 [Falco rusticolus]XP_055559384.1 ubiquitin carboxyl-terminal hydrolase 16 isoform X1 [Falco cherrug]XP_055559385.1 ubiquitin carboxyl-terminal hydrolase 16 isoform X1 [Falco cherrug]XP_055657955.1 ubiquitin carboxyl-terminal hydrolase 16 isoform X1 [Falco peregrinus]XP_05
MGKKRTKGKTAQSDESLDTLEPVCKHIRKGLEQGHLKKALLNVEWHVCQDCKADNKRQEKSEEEADRSPSIWLCLKCGHRGCGRNSQEQHALKHYATPRSDPHCLVLSLDNWSVWCYICDNEVPYNTSTRLGQTVDYVRKQVCIDSSRTVEKQQENKGFENKKVEKDSKNEQEKEVSLKEENSHSSTNAEVAVKGLSNLGNTCFFNAVMQNLSQTPVLRELLKEAKMPGTTVKIESPELSMEPQLIKLDQPGPLTLAMYQFLTEMQETKKGVVTPKELFAQVCKKATRFKGYQQQDSHELLRYLLDGMRAEEIQQVSVGILKAVTDSNKQNEEELKKKIKEYEKKRGIQSFVDRIFGGELTSTIMCEECRTVSLVHESFLDLSLPILDDQKVKITNERNLKKPKDNKSEDEENKNNDCYLKQRDEPPGTSKHLQKKAKKQAKKQAKSQRRQQKLQGKVLHFTDICATEQSEKDVEYNQESEVEINSETCDMKQEEEWSDYCKDHCLTQKDLSIQGDNTEVQSMHENTGKTEQGCVEKEFFMDLPMEGSDSPVKVVNGLDNLSLKDEDDENEDEEELATDFSKLHLGASAESDTSTLDDLQTVPVKTCEVSTEDPETAFCTLANREDLNPEEGSIHHCLYQFTRNEKLTETNKLLCDVCTQRHYGPKKNTKSEKKYIYTNAKKQMLISLAPPILTLHLKRFQQAGFNLQKVNRHIKFPEVIDLAPFCTAKCKNVAEGNTKVLYSLYGVVEHSGTMRSGHYTAYAKMRNMNNHLSDLVLRGQSPEALETEPVKGQWFHISDTHVQAVSASKVLSSQAYLLFYERLL